MMTSSGARSRASWTESAIWAGAHAINDGYPTLYLPLLPILMQRWHFAAAQAGLLAGLLALTTQALQPLLGAWADRRGGPWFIVGGLGAFSKIDPDGSADGCQNSLGWAAI
ncbi:MFS transporter, partial [Sulfobacillus sp. DSM 109850]|nr:MFS transporter [Sulfobacillus harzensis]